jgi:hypothetical protein
VKLVHIREYRNRGLVAVLKELTQLAEDGHINGLAFVVKVGRRGHKPGLAGDYRRNPSEALTAAVRLQDTLLQDPELDAGSGI